ncbi:MAG: helix-turn-helix transcriptional regulator [Thermomicrobiales bacterium]
MTTSVHPVAQGPDRSTNLTRRQRQVLRLQAYGLTYQEISEKLGLSIWTVKNHHKQAIRALHAALGGNSRQPIRTSLACYILGLIDGGLSPADIAKHLRQVQKQVRDEMLGDESEDLAETHGRPQARVLDETYAA